jgi:hypothetical protein
VYRLAASENEDQELIDADNQYLKSHPLRSDTDSIREKNKARSNTDMSSRSADQPVRKSQNDANKEPFFCPRCGHRELPVHKPIEAKEPWILSEGPTKTTDINLDEFDYVARRERQVERYHLPYNESDLLSDVKVPRLFNWPMDDPKYDRKQKVNQLHRNTSPSQTPYPDASRLQSLEYYAFKPFSRTLYLP